MPAYGPGVLGTPLTSGSCLMAVPLEYTAASHQEDEGPKWEDGFPERKPRQTLQTFAGLGAGPFPPGPT